MGTSDASGPLIVKGATSESLFCTESAVLNGGRPARFHRQTEAGYNTAMDQKPTDSPDPEAIERLESDKPEEHATPSELREGGGPKISEKPVEIELLRFDTGKKDRWSKAAYSRGCAVVACVVGAVILIAVFMGGYSSIKRSVWVGFDAARERVSTGLPFEMTANQRKNIRADMNAFTEVLQEMDDPFETMGKFTSEVHRGFRDGLLSMRDIERIEIVLDEILRSEASEVPPEK